MSAPTLDVVIAGGGPVGLAAGLYAHRAGLSVEIHEPRSGVIDKACGEGLMPGAVGQLAELGIELDGVPLRGIRYLAPGASATADFRDGPGRGVRRTTLHAALQEAVDAAGIPVVRKAVASIVQEPDVVYVDDIPARYLLAADGLHSSVRRLCGLAAAPDERRRFGIRAHAAVAPWSEHVEVHWASGAEAYVTPVGPAQVGIAVLSSGRTSYADLLRAFPALWNRLQEVDLSRPRGAGPLRQRSTRRVRGRVLLVGDAAGYVDALTGEGISLGLAQARAAVAAIRAGRPASYELAWQRVTWRYRLLTSALLRASRLAPVRRALVPAAAALPWVFGAAVNELARPPALGLR